MKFAIAIVAVFGLGVGELQVQIRPPGPTRPLQPPPAAAPAQLSRSVWDGVYTIAQAKRGSAQAERCEHCHTSDVNEGAPAWMGPKFTGKWDGRTLGDLFELVLINFESTNDVQPTHESESLIRQRTADFLAFLLIQNHFPAGKAELPVDLDVLNQIRFEASKP